LPDELVKSVDRTARRLKRSRADVIRHALEYYLEDQEDLTRGLERLQDPGDPLLDWDEVRRGLLDED
jgi:predicted DNA-binding protein